jgi:hypothetical protein
MTVKPVYRTILILDIKRFGRANHDDLIRVRLRRALREVLAEALSEAGIPAERCSTSDTGDGLLVLVDPAIPTARVVRAMLDLFAAVAEETAWHARSRSLGSVRPFTPGSCCWTSRAPRASSSTWRFASWPPRNCGRGWHRRRRRRCSACPTTSTAGRPSDVAAISRSL